jgi:hypothetical protein
MVLISGEAGVGKSALVEGFQRELPGARWSWGMCDGLFTPRPLGPLFDVAEQRGGALLELCRAGAGREELFRGLLRELSEPGTLDVVVVEDVHWADEATLDLLRYLGRRLSNVPALLLVTYRDEDLSSLQVVLGDLASRPSTGRIELAPLSPDAVGALSGASGWQAAALHRLTGGNPFYVTELVRAGNPFYVTELVRAANPFYVTELVRAANPFYVTELVRAANPFSATGVVHAGEVPPPPGTRSWRVRPGWAIRPAGCSTWRR